MVMVVFNLCVGATGLKNPGNVKLFCLKREGQALINVQCRCMWKILQAGCMEEIQFVVIGNVGVTSIILCRDGI